MHFQYTNMGQCGICGGSLAQCALDKRHMLGGAVTFPQEVWDALGIKIDKKVLEPKYKTEYQAKERI